MNIMSECEACFGHSRACPVCLAGYESEVRRTIDEDVLPAMEMHALAIAGNVPVPAVEPEASLLSLMPGRNRAERRFALHCARRALRGTLSRHKREKVERLAHEQERARIGAIL